MEEEFELLMAFIRMRTELTTKMALRVEYQDKLSIWGKYYDSWPGFTHFYELPTFEEFKKGNFISGHWIELYYADGTKQYNQSPPDDTFLCYRTFDRWMGYIYNYSNWVFNDKTYPQFVINSLKTKYEI